MRQMKKDGAAATPDAGPEIDIEYQDDVIGMIVAPHRLVTPGIWTADRPIVVAVRRIVAPAVVRPERNKRNAGARSTSEPIRPVETADDAETPPRTRPIAFPLQCRQTRPTDRRRQINTSTDKSPMRAMGRCHANVKARERQPLRFQLAVHIFRLA